MKKGIFLILIFGFVIQSNAQNDTIFNKDFNDQDIVSGGWSNELVSGSQNCFWDIFVSANSAGRVSNYSSGQNQACESWLISPSVDLTNSSPFLSFRSSYNFSGDHLAILISSDYVAGDPSLAAWTDISSMANMPTEDGFVWANSGLIDNFSIRGFGFSHRFSAHCKNTTQRLNKLIISKGQLYFIKSGKY